MLDNYMKEAIKRFNLKVSKIDNVPDSYSSQVARIVLESGEKVIIKIPYNTGKLLREITILNKLKDKIPVPEVLDYFDTGDGKNGGILMSYIDGVPITGMINEDLVYQMGELLAKLHCVKAEYFGEVKKTNVEADDKNDWWKVMFRLFKEWIPLCENILPADMIIETANYFEELYHKLPSPDGPCVVHVDYRPGNILVKNNKIVGLIDFESAKYGSADIDFTKIKNSVWDKELKSKETFLKAYSSKRNVPDIEKTLPFYLLYNAFAGIGWCIKRGNNDGVYLSENISHLKKILKEKNDK